MPFSSGWANHHPLRAPPPPLDDRRLAEEEILGWLSSATDVRSLFRSRTVDESRVELRGAVSAAMDLAAAARRGHAAYESRSKGLRGMALSAAAASSRGRRRCSPP
mmetsp:Transcript_61225/g.181074  ORF Transcript_61225/g.181074 Transcript_61225/m.181074 type:complete len:106 (-) Transcript_61225:162-479(-)